MKITEFWSGNIRTELRDLCTFSGVVSVSRATNLYLARRLLLMSEEK